MREGFWLGLHPYFNSNSFIRFLLVQILQSLSCRGAWRGRRHRISRPARGDVRNAGHVRMPARCTSDEHQMPGASGTVRHSKRGYLFLFMMRVSYFPVSISMNLTNSDTLLSSLRLFHTVSANASMSPVMSTFSGSPSKLGSGFPSPT